MNKRINIIEYIAQKKQEGLLYMPYLTVGDPDFEATIRFGIEMIDAGASILELGIPFSDPTADGPVIQAAMVRALEHPDFSLERVFEVARSIHEERPKTPLVFLSYINPVLSGFRQEARATQAQEASSEDISRDKLQEYSLHRFLAECERSGICGLVIPDLPFDAPESRLLRRLAFEYGVSQILLVAPNTSDERMKSICEAARGFIYYVTSLGVTGVRTTLPPELKERVELVQRLSGLPVLAGFGIGSPDQIEPLKGVLDGAIVGSLNHRIISEIRGRGGDATEMTRELGKTTAAFVRACQAA